MHTIRRLAAVTLAAVLTSVGLLPAQPAAAGNQSSVDIWDHSTFEYNKTCSSQSTCNNISGTSLRFVVNVLNRPKPNHAIDIDWALVDVTTSAGADYTGPTSGRITLAPRQSQASLVFPVVNDGVGEPTETVELHITDISESVDISDVGVGTIRDGAQIPEDCTLGFVDTFERSLTCNERPAGQDWHLNVLCLSFGIEGVAIGNTVTGNGSSNARCNVGFAANPFFILES